MSDNSDDRSRQQEPKQQAYEGGLVYCLCCGVPMSANKSVFGISVYFPLLPPDHFCRQCAKSLRVTPFES